MLEKKRLIKKCSRCSLYTVLNSITRERNLQIDGQMRMRMEGCSMSEELRD